ncbi:MAG: glycosyltransferase family 4 protein [Planctomycetota bacterium]
MRRLLLLRGSNFLGGPEKQILHSAKRIRRYCYDCVIGSFLKAGDRSEFLESAAAAGLGTLALPLSGTTDIRPWRALAAWLRAEATELLCTHDPRSTFMGWFLRSKLRIPVLAYSRGFTAESPRVALYEALERFALRRVDGVVCVSEGQRRRLESLRVRPRRVWVVHNAVDVPDGEEPWSREDRAGVFREFGLPDHAALAVCAGRLSPEKGQRFLVQAIALLKTKGAAPHVVFCGDGACRPGLELAARRLGVDSLCRFVGFRRDIDRIFRAMDFLVLPSLTEGLPNVVLEAAARAKPTVATCVGGVPEVVTDGHDGLLVPPRSPEALAAGIERLLRSDELRLRLGFAARETARRRFDFASQTKKLVAIYDELLQRAAGPRAGQATGCVSEYSGTCDPCRFPEGS